MYHVVRMDMESHRVTELGPRGEPRQIVCLTHEGCTWRRDLAGPTKPTDPVVMALVRAHIRERQVPTPAMMGHPKRARS